eukprot:54262-Eustigmatos_ZCMA.PRE.1
MGSSGLLVVPLGIGWKTTVCKVTRRTNDRARTSWSSQISEDLHFPESIDVTELHHPADWSATRGTIERT